MLTTAFRVYYVVETPDGSIFAEDGSYALQVSTDNGKTWNPVPGASFAATNLIANGLGELVAGTRTTPPTVYTCRATGCTQATGISGAASKITGFTEDKAGVMYAINTNANLIHRSNDHGHTWTAINATLPSATGIGMAWCIEANAYGLMMGGEIGPIVQSTDGGMTWVDRGLYRSSVRTPTEYNGNLWAIATDPVSGNVLAAVGDPDVPGKGAIQVHRPSDALGVWHGVQGLQGSAGEDFSGWVFQKDGSILAGAILRTPGTGEVYKSTDAGATWVEISSKIGMAFKGQTRLHIGPSGCLYIAHGLGLVRNCSGY